MSFFTLTLLTFCAAYYVGAILYRTFYDWDELDIVEIAAALVCAFFIVCVWIF